MPLRDAELRALLPEMDITVPSYASAFNERQIQPASIDLRVDRVHWRAQRLPFPLDLSSGFRASILSRRPTFQADVGAEGKFRLRPGGIIMGRTVEKFTIPSRFTAEIFTRSSFARLGLLVTFGGFINPGYRGQMPLQIRNLGSHTIYLPPLIPICQLVIHELSAPPEQDYAATLHSKYKDDDGGPSRWWQDEILKAAQKALGAANIPEQEQDKLLTFMFQRDLSTQYRFDKFVSAAKPHELESADATLDAFSRKEYWSQIAYRLRMSSIAAWLAFFGVSLGSVFGLPVGETGYGAIHYAIWAIAAALTPVALWSAWNRLSGRETGFLVPDVLTEIRARDA